MRDATTGRTSNAKRATGTDWNRLRRVSDAEIRKGIESDPDARATDEEFWRNATVVWPSR